MGVLDPPPQRTGGCGGPRPRCSAASPPQRRPKRAALPEQRVRSCRSAVEVAPASVTERETALDGRHIEPNHGRNRQVTATYGRAVLKCSSTPAAEQDRRSTGGRRDTSALLGASHDVIRGVRHCHAHRLFSPSEAVWTDPQGLIGGFTALSSHRRVQSASSGARSAHD